ncbi:MAG: orotidine 5'-phosphate decarboxylase / HUMPS family protein, partial [Trichococcus flocculiformis]
WEARMIKDHTNEDFICLTPGIRPAGSAVGDQKRVATPGRAREIGSTFIVVGRPITQAADPVAAYHEIKNQWNGAE